MRAALIPPKGYERFALESDIHLVLPMVPMMSNKDYVQTYVTARARGDYIILDNGAAEQQLVDGERLMNVARALRPHEIVAPDVLHDAAGTLEATNSFLAEFPEARDYNIMGVLQGDNLGDRQYLLNQYAKNDSITAIGIPKCLITEDDPDIRRRDVRRIRKNYPGRFNVHLLGLSSLYPNEIAEFGFGKFVRSMDSAQPFKVTEAGIFMSESECDAKRREDYFSYKKEVDTRLLVHNITVFKQWATGGSPR